MIESVHSSVPRLYMKENPLVPQRLKWIFVIETPNSTFHFPRQGLHSTYLLFIIGVAFMSVIHFERAMYSSVCFNPSR
jgi:hypothetical protein